MTHFSPTCRFAPRKATPVQLVEKVRQKGSHAFYRHADGRTTTIPFHSNKSLARPLIRVILNEINITIEEYNELIRNI